MFMLMGCWIGGINWGMAAISVMGTGGAIGFLKVSGLYTILNGFISYSFDRNPGYCMNPTEFYNILVILSINVNIQYSNIIKK